MNKISIISAREEYFPLKDFIRPDSSRLQYNLNANDFCVKMPVLADTSSFSFQEVILSSG